MRAVLPAAFNDPVAGRTVGFQLMAAGRAPEKTWLDQVAATVAMLAFLFPVQVEKQGKQQKTCRDDEQKRDSMRQATMPAIS